LACLALGFGFGPVVLGLFFVGLPVAFGLYCSGDACPCAGCSGLLFTGYGVTERASGGRGRLAWFGPFAAALNGCLDAADRAAYSVSVYFLSHWWCPSCWSAGWRW